MPKYFHSLPAQNGLYELPDEACTLLSFAKLRLAAGETYEGTIPDDRESVMVALAGTADVRVSDRTFVDVGGRGNVFDGLPHTVYLPRGARFAVTAKAAFEAALPAGPSDLDIDPYEVRPDEVDVGTWGALNYTRTFRKILVDGDGRPASSLIVGETITPSGNWSTFPPHKHEVTEDGEVFHEEMYYFRNASPDGYGLTQHYSPERGYDDIHRVEDDTLLSMPHGYHTYVAAPGTASYYLWFLAGDGRAQGTSFDPKLGWVQKTVGMV